MTCFGWGNVTLKRASLLFGLVGIWTLLGSGPVHAYATPGEGRPMIEILDDSYEFRGDPLPPLSLAWIGNPHDGALYYVWEDGSPVPVYRRDTGIDIESMEEIASRGPKYQLVIEFLEDLIHFVQGFDEQGENHTTGDFRGQFFHEINEKWPGWAWVLVAYRSSTTLDNGGVIRREGGGFGVQIPLLGSGDLFLKEGRSTVVLRVMPLAGNLETSRLPTGEGHDTIESEDSGIRIRPTAEIEGRTRLGGVLSPVEIGIRALFQPNLVDIGDYRFAAEAFINFRIPMSGAFREIHITPRCMVDFSSQPDVFTGPLGTPGYPSSGGRISLFDSWLNCNINIKFAFGS